MVGDTEFDEEDIIPCEDDDVIMDCRLNLSPISINDKHALTQRKDKICQGLIDEEKKKYLMLSFAKIQNAPSTVSKLKPTQKL
jgi:hypothetical protein